MALVLGLLMSAGLYFAYLWPSVEPDEDEVPAADAPTKADAKPPEAKQPAKQPDEKATVEEPAEA